MARAIIVGSPLFLDQNQRNASAFTSAIAISVSFAPKIGDLANADASAANNIGPLSAISARPPSPSGVSARASDASGSARNAPPSLGANTPMLPTTTPRPQKQEQK